MLSLFTLTDADITSFGRRLFDQYKQSLSSFEEAASRCAKAMYDEFVDDKGNPAFILLRIFRVFDRDYLPAELQDLLKSDTTSCMALIGTYGREPAWRDRRKSRGHQVLSMGQDRAPMVAAALNQLRLHEVQVSPAIHLESSSMFTSYFLVENALGSAAVPSQTEFVQPYHVASVIGLGSSFTSKSAFILLGFSTVPISRDIAEHLTGLTPFVGTILATYDARGQIWQAA